MMNGVPIIGERDQQEVQARVMAQLEQQAMFQSLLFNTVQQLFVANMQAGNNSDYAANKAVDDAGVLMKRLGVAIKVAAPPLKEDGTEPESQGYVKQD